MGVLFKIAVAVLSISFVVFVIFFGRLPAFRKTPVGAIYRLLVVRTPSALYRLDQRMFNGKFSASGARFSHYMMHERHPTVLIFFGLLLSVSEVLFLPDVFPRLGTLMKILAVIIIASPYLFLHLAAQSDPGYIVKSNHNYHGSLYPYDHVLYHPGQTCRTCQLIKPARSKHCSLCGHCISRLDHHCIFINNCVGLGNLHWFLLLLFSTAVLTTAGTILGFDYILHVVLQGVYPQFTVFNSGLGWADYITFWHWALQESPCVGGVALLCFCITPLVAGLFLYNFYQVWAGYSTNEGGKWSDLKLDTADGIIFTRLLAANRRKDPRFEPPTTWPKEPKHFLIERNEAPLPSEKLPGTGEWTQLWTISQLDNVYDVGFLGNLADVFLPREVFEQLVDY